jgi:hypothetical protein
MPLHLQLENSPVVYICKAEITKFKNLGFCFSLFMFEELLAIYQHTTEQTYSLATKFKGELSTFLEENIINVY